MSGINWNEIKTVEDFCNLGDHLLYDESPEVQDDVKPRCGLTMEDMAEAAFWQPYMKGIMLVTGMPGQGKGIFLHMLTFLGKHLYGRTAILDTRPRKSFGLAIPFSEEMLDDQFIRMTEVATGQIIEDKKPRKKKKIDEDEYDEEIVDTTPKITPHVEADGRWISSRGEVFMRRSIMGLDEFGTRYMYVRRPMERMQVKLLRLFPLWRHLQCVIVGVGTERDDFSPRCFPKVTCEVRVQRLSEPGLKFGVKVFPLRYVGATEELEVAGRKVKFRLDGEKPRECIAPVHIELVDKDVAKEYELTDVQKVTMDILEADGKATVAQVRQIAGDSESLRREIDMLETVGAVKISGLGWKDIYNTDNAQAMPLSGR